MKLLKIELVMILEVKYVIIIIQYMSCCYHGWWLMYLTTVMIVVRAITFNFVLQQFSRYMFVRLYSSVLRSEGSPPE